ncbi:histidine kinase, partial [Fervidobacterium sp. SC_NGM5_O18]
MGLITLSDHVHDIAENSINAKAKNVKLVIEET